GNPVGAEGTVGGRLCAVDVAGPADAPHHPAAGGAADAAALGQPADRASEGNRAGRAHLGGRPDVPGQADQHLHLPGGTVSRHRAGHLLPARPRDRDAVHALAGTGDGAEARPRMTFDWNWEFTWEILPRLLSATVNTLLAAGIGYAIALVLGLVLALAQRTPSK